jgi:tetratricopeptide (TPR) repeat protein
MALGNDPYETYLKRAADLFEAGDIVPAGQIWQAILKKKPDHEAARAGLYKVKLYFDARATQSGLTELKAAPAPPDPQEAPKSPDTEIVRLLEQGCTLYDAGHVQDAIARWTQVLAKEPGNVLAKGYISGAHRALEQAPSPRPESSVPAPSPALAHPGPDVDVERLLRDGCTLFDMGQVEDALRKWEEVLAHDPEHALARAYIQDARKDLGLPLMEEGTQPLPHPVHAESHHEPPAEEGPIDERLEALIRDGVQLYDMGMVQEAQGKWQQVLALSPGHRNAEAYLAMALRDQHATPPSAAPAPKPAPVASAVAQGSPRLPLKPQPTPAPKPMLELALPASTEETTEAQEASAQGVMPPAAVISGQQKPRIGFNLQEALSKLSLPTWMVSPAFILGTITGLVVLVIGTFYFLQHRKDEALRQSVAAFRATATAPVQRGSEILKLVESPEEVQRAAQSALGADPLMAYFKAEECVRLNPGDAAAAQLLERAKAGLGQIEEKPATMDVFEQQFKTGELEAADHSISYLLSQNPDDPVLRERAGRLYLALVQAYATKEQWPEAQDHLRRGQALFPSDLSWRAKLILLARIQSMGKSERTSWIQLLG